MAIQVTYPKVGEIEVVGSGYHAFSVGETLKERSWVFEPNRFWLISEDGEYIIYLSELAPHERDNATIKIEDHYFRVLNQFLHIYGSGCLLCDF